MKKKVAVLLATLALAVSVAPAQAAPEPIAFCMPDLDGHCRYCEIRFAPFGIVCVSH